MEALSAEGISKKLKKKNKNSIDRSAPLRIIQNRAGAQRWAQKQNSTLKKAEKSLDKTSEMVIIKTLKR